MADSLSLSLILPTLDEAEALEELLPELLTEIEGLAQLIVVDDGSTDGTRALVRAAATRDSRVSLIARDAAPTLVGSLREGVANANADLVGWMDGDGTIRASDVVRLVDAVRDGAEVAVGSRFALGGRIKGQKTDGPVGRLAAALNVYGTGDASIAVLGSWLLNVAVLPVILGDGVHDYTSGFVVGRRSTIEGLELRGQHGEYFVDLWMQARRRGVRVVEVPYRAQPRRKGRSKTVTRPSDYVLHARRYFRAALKSRGRSDS